MNFEQRIALIQATMPDLALKQIDEMETGWDHDIVVINKEKVFRFPKTKEVVKRTKIESWLLHDLVQQKQLNLEVPNPVLVFGNDSQLLYSWYELIKGKESGDPGKTGTEANAKRLGEFLAVLHSLVLPEYLEKRHTRAYWELFYGEIQQEIFPHITMEEQLEIQDTFGSFFSHFDEEQQATVIHGDLTASNILFDAKNGQIKGIIDFADAQIGDAAFDFAGIYWDYGAAFTKMVLRYYKGTEEATEILPRVQHFYGLQPVFHELLYAVKNKEKVQWNKALEKFKKLKRQAFDGM